jgi:hypothetical protein
MAEATTSAGDKTLELPVVVKTYFTVITDDGNFIKAKCNLCNLKSGKSKGKSICRQYKAPSNFTKHIKVL